MKRFSLFFVALLAISQLAACASPEEKAAEYVESAQELFEQGDLTKAEIEFKNALQINQNLPDAWYGLARIHERKQQWRQAYGVLNRVRESSPNHVDSRIMLGQLLLASNQIEQALTDANEILELAPEDARAHALMGAVQFRLGNNEAATEAVNRALGIDADNNEAMLVRSRVLIAEKKFDEAIAQLDRSIAGDPDNVSMYLMKIQAYSEKQDNDSIETVYNDLIERFPENVAFRHALARSHLQRGDIEGAERILTALVEAVKDNEDEKIRLVRFTQQYRSTEQAIDLLKKYIAQDQDNYRLRFALGELYERAPDPDAARSVYEQIASDDGLQPNGLEARNKLALLKLRAGEPEAARSLVDEVLAQEPANESALLVQAGFKINERKYDDAIVDLRTVLRDNPESLKALLLLGQAYQASGSGELAVESYQKAYQINPGNPQAANRLAFLLLRQRNAEQANEVMQKSMQSGNNSVGALKILTDIKLRLGEWDEAERLAQQLQQMEGQEAISEQVMGIIFQGRAQQSESIEAFKRAHELAPGASQPLLSLVRTYVQNGQNEEAKVFLQSVVEENEKNIAAYLLLGQLSLLENRVDDAIVQFKKIVEVNPNVDTGYRNLSSLYLREQRADDAEAITRKGLEAIPDSNTLAINLASIYERQGRFDEAIATYENMLERNPDLIVAKNNLASLLTDHRDSQESHDRARQMAAPLKDSQIPQFRDTYAWAAVRSGINLEEAIVILEDVVRENEQVGVYHYHLGEAYRKKGDMENAVATLEKAVALERPGSDIANKAKQALSQIN